MMLSEDRHERFSLALVRKRKEGAPPGDYPQRFVTGIRAWFAIWYNTCVISRGKEMPQYLKQNPSLLTKVVDYLVVCVNDFADAHGLSYPNAHEYLSKYRGLAFLVDCYEAEHLLSLDEALDDIRQICRQNGGTI